MASAPQQNQLPLFYSDLVPLSSSQHGTWRAHPMGDLKFIANTHAVPLTVEEFVAVQRTMPIVFSMDENPVPLALFGLNEGVNLFVDEAGQWNGDSYLPAYVRRYPFMLVRSDPQSDQLSLCFDPTPGLFGPFEDGAPLFDGDQPSDDVKGMLSFCEQFEMGAQRSIQFVTELKQLDLLIDGEVTIEVPGAAQPFVYRGFKMVAEDRLRDLRGDQLRKMAQSGMLPLVHAHIFSLQLLSVLFQRQQAAGKVPGLVQG